MSKKNIHVILSPGRTGSHIIWEMLTGKRGCVGGLANAYALELPFDKDDYLQFAEDHNVVIHLHDIREIKDLDKSAVTLIISIRRDLYAQAMSMCVALTVNQWSGVDYRNNRYKIVEPIVFEKTKFIDIVHKLKNWPYKLNLSDYKKVVTIYYEDLVNQGPKFLANKLELNYNRLQVGPIHQPSPHRYQDIILNWKELQQEYLKIINGVVL